MNTSGYVMSYRSTFEHWVADDPKTFMAWQEIVHAAAYEDYRLEVSGQTVQLARGEVNITGIESRRFFTDKQWRSFIERLVECQMIARVAVYPLGRGNGSITVYHVVSYDSYQSKNEGGSKGVSNGMSNGSAKGSPKPTVVREERQSEGVPKGGSNGTSKGRSKGSPYKKNSIREEVKNKDSRRAREAPPEDQKAYNLVAYASSHYIAEWLRDARGFDFSRAVAIWGDSLEDLWRAAVSAESRRPGDQARFRFQGACEGVLELGVRPSRADQDHAPPVECLPAGTPVSHPVWGEDVVRCYWGNGQIVLDGCGALVSPTEVTPCPN